MLIGVGIMMMIMCLYWALTVNHIQAGFGCLFCMLILILLDTLVQSIRIERGYKEAKRTVCLDALADAVQRSILHDGNVSHYNQGRILGLAERLRDESR